MYISSTRGLNKFENVILQGVLAGLSIYVGRRSTQRVTKPHAQSAVRRLSDLYRALYWAASLIMELLQTPNNEDYQVRLARIEGILRAHLPTASNAIKDWNEFAPEDVAKSMREFEPDNTVEENNG